MSRAFAALPRLGLRFDALVKSAHLPALLRAFERESGLPVVVDHGAKPAIAAGEWEPWASLIAPCRQSTRALQALGARHGSGGGGRSTRCGVTSIICSTCFGAQRLLWGSDWPVVLRGDLSALVRGDRGSYARLDAEDRAALIGGNAGRFYGL